jgi:hypothetical protein
MRTRHSTVDRFDDGFRCAYFFHHGDRALALGIVFAALDGMNVKTLDLKNKLDFSRRLAGKSEQVQIKKLSLSGPQLLQYLILKESAEVEREQEAAGDPKLREEDLLIRYIKHAVVLAWRRLSFHMAVALWRVIHKYETEEVRVVDEFLTGKSRISFADICRRAKKDLMDSLQLRFGNYLELVPMAGNEHRFCSKDWMAHRTLISQCLELLTPWCTPCLIHDEAGVPAFASNGRRQRVTDPEQLERNRIHSHVHPGCFERLTKINALPEPGSMLDLPKFTLAENSGQGEPPTGNPSSGERPLPHLTDDEISQLKAKLAAQAGRRRADSPPLLKVVVDGELCARVNLSETRSLTFQIRNGAELLKVYGQDDGGDLLLALHLMEYDEAGGLEAAHAMVRLPGAKQIDVIVAPDPASGSASVTILYRIGVFSSLLAAARRTVSRPMPMTKLVPAAVLTILALIGAAIFMIRRGPPERPAPITEVPKRQPVVPPQTPSKQEEPDAADRLLASILVRPYSLAGGQSRVESIPGGPGRVELQFSIPAGETRFSSYRVVVKNGVGTVTGVIVGSKTITVADVIVGHKTVTVDGKQYRVVPVVIPAELLKEERLDAWVSGRQSGHEDELLEVYSLRLARGTRRK